MLVACVYVHVLPEYRDAFLTATLENARNSIKEPGCLRFDVNQGADNPDYFLLYEVYRDEQAATAHKSTPHYLQWRDAVANWMAEPRQAVRHVGRFPESEEQWLTRGG